MKRPVGVLLPPLGVALVLSALLLPPIPRPLHTPVIGYALDLLHVPLFAATFLAALRILRPRMRRADPAAAGLSVAMAGVLEVLQGMTSREPSWSDFALSLLGVALAWWGVWSWRRRAPWRAGHAAVALAFAVAGVGLFARQVTVSRAVAAMMPVLATFEHPWELERWHAKEATTMARTPARTGDGWSLEVRCSRSPTYPGVSIEDFEGDWRPYRWLEWSIRMASPEPMRLAVRIDDDQGARFGDRYTAYIPIVPSREVYRIDLRAVATHFREHPMNLAHVTELHFFLDAPDSPRVFWLDDVRLFRE